MGKTVAILLLTLLATACATTPTADVEQMNAVYYWRTELHLDSAETDFIGRHNISRIYCRYFDVVMNDASGPVPHATISLPEHVTTDIETVPTVFIVEDCMHQRHDSLARRIVDRIVQMNETHGVKGVKEIQIDCDYTRNSRDTYYAFLDKVRSEAQRHGLRLSTTIRLHQLSMPPPPADEGVLMLYNTGDPAKFMERNPILDMRDVQPYLTHLAGYDLPLSAAYPVFLWQRDIHGVRVEHTVEGDEILRVKHAVEHERKDLRQRIITYHLSEENINRYNTSTYEEIYSH